MTASTFWGTTANAFSVEVGARMTPATRAGRGSWSGLGAAELSRTASQGDRGCALSTRFSSLPGHHVFGRSAEPKLPLRPQQHPRHNRCIKDIGRIPEFDQQAQSDGWCHRNVEDYERSNQDMPLCAVATRMRGYQQLLLWPLACASSIGISPRHSSGRGGSAKPRGAPGFTGEHCGAIIDPGTHRTLNYAHIQVRDLMKLLVASR